jgi:riboflavin-specific deaminase-like protein
MHTLINVAMTADGKLAPANRRFVPFGGKRDIELLLDLRARCDAVMSGARTVDLYPVNLGPGPKRFREKRLKRGLAEYNLRIIVSGSGSLNPRAPIFEKRFSPIIVLCSERITRARLNGLRAVASEVAIFGERELDFVQAFRWLEREWNVKRLVCEGGGEVNDGLLRAGLVDEVYVTICPLIFGGRGAPTPADGKGFPNLASALELELRSKKRIGDELFLAYGVAGRTNRTRSKS